MAKGKRRGLRGLGAVEGEKVEYFLPASIFNTMGRNAKSTIAFCMKDVEELLPYLDQQAAFSAMKAKRLESRGENYASVAASNEWYREAAEKKAKAAARSAKTKAKAGDVYSQVADEMRKDVAAIRAQGITGPIPVCVYRTSGKYGDKALKSAEARANRHHERFHADSRRVEYREGVPHYGCDANIASVLDGALDPALTAFSRTYWSPNGKASNEEILARVEETMEACGGSGEDCADVMGRINDWFVGKRKPELAASFVQATAAVKAKHGGPLEVMKKACRVPAGFSGMRRRRGR
jgi:hypothetical protein